MSACWPPRRRSPARAGVASGVLVVLLAAGGLPFGASPARAQEVADEGPPTTAERVLAGALLGADAMLGLWIATMPWRGFWGNRADAADPWALTLSGVLAVAAGVAGGLLVGDSRERYELELFSAAVAGELALGVGLFGGLYELTSPPSRHAELRVKLLFATVPLLGVAVGLVGALVHRAVD